MRAIADFARRLGSSVKLDENLLVHKENRYFLLNMNLKRLIGDGFFYAGLYLGKTKDGKFFPSFTLLAMMARKKANKVFVNAKTEWLFVCGRDVFSQGIARVAGSKRKGDYTLILNQFGECLGFGKIQHDLDEAKRGVAVKNISDMGDFLRRESST